MNRLLLVPLFFAIACVSKTVTGPDLVADAPESSDISPEPGADLAEAPEILDTTAPDVFDTTAPDGCACDVGLPWKPPKAVAAFSRDGKRITVRFAKPLPAGAPLAAFAVVGSDAKPVALSGVEAEGPFATIALAAPLDPARTFQVRVTDGGTGEPEQVLPVKGTVALSLVWLQDMDDCLDPETDALICPWVRKNATRDFFGLAALLEDFPDLHQTVILSPVLVRTLRHFYEARLGPYVDTQQNRVDAVGFLAKWRGRTDPWLDALLDATPDPEGKLGPKPTEAQKSLYHAGPWSFLSTAPEVLKFFPEYKALRDKAPSTYTHADFLALKVFWSLAWFDPAFLDGPVGLPAGYTVDLSDIVAKDAYGRYTLKQPASEDLANRLAAEEFKVLANVVAIHQALRYEPTTRKGQLEVATSPDYHAILPLLQDTDVAKPDAEPVPAPAFRFPQDAAAQTLRAVAMHEALFGAKLDGVWPSESAVSDATIRLLRDLGLRWTIVDQGVLGKAFAAGDVPTGFPDLAFASTAGDAAQRIAIFSRESALGANLGYKYAKMDAADAVSDFLAGLSAAAPPYGGPDRVVTVLILGCCGWESYEADLHARKFLRGLYGALADGQVQGESVTVTPMEYLDGNPDRGVAPHPAAALPVFDPVPAGTWMNGFSTWVGEPEETAAWTMLRAAREALEGSKVPAPDPMAKPPEDAGAFPGLAWTAWEAMYAAESSAFFWYFGQDMEGPGGTDADNDRRFRAHLYRMYTTLNLALATQGESPVPVPPLDPIVPLEN